MHLADLRRFSLGGQKGCDESEHTVTMARCACKPVTVDHLRIVTPVYNMTRPQRGVHRRSRNRHVGASRRKFSLASEDTL